MTISDRITVSHLGHVTVVEMCKPPHNFIDYETVRDIADAFNSADQDSNCRAVVLAAQGKSFCAGADFGAGASNADGFAEDHFVSTASKLYAEAVRLFNNKKPVVAAIQGAAIGGGLGLALVPDFRVVSARSRLSANFAKLGIHQGFGLSHTLPRLIGQQQAARLLLNACDVRGEEALAIGLADKLAEEEAVLQTAIDMAQELATKAPLAQMSIRATLRAGLAEAVQKATQHELAEQTWLRETEDAAEGIQSVFERREGNFKGL